MLQAPYSFRPAADRNHESPQTIVNQAIDTKMVQKRLPDVPITTLTRIDDEPDGTFVLL